MKPRVPDFFIREQLRLEDRLVTLADKVIASRFIDWRHPIQIFLPALMYSPGVARADLAQRTLRDFMRQYLTGSGAQRMGQIIQRTSP
jgi:hypothetical protein